MLNILKRRADFGAAVTNGACRLADALICIPRRAHEENASIHDLLKESGYLTSPAAIAENAIREALAEHTEFIADWHMFSLDKRCGGWFWQECPRGGFDLGYICRNGASELHEGRWYPDELSACAAFIKREIEEIRATDFECRS
jgi:hypothetical protein